MAKGSLFSTPFTETKGRAPKLPSGAKYDSTTKDHSVSDGDVHPRSAANSSPVHQDDNAITWGTLKEAITGEHE